MELPPNESKYIFIEIDFTLTAVAILERMNSNSIVFFQLITNSFPKQYFCNTEKRRN